MPGNPSERPLDPAWQRPVRRMLDVAGAALLLLLTVPILLAVAVAITLESGGPVLFRQLRVGRHRTPFTLFKFRTMRTGGDDSAHRAQIAAEIRGEDTSVDGSWKLDDDPRVTVVGRWLRRTSIDELPQLINVLRGDMALVGPRPCLEWEAEMFPADYAARFSVRPGLTGLWQTTGRSTVGTLEMLQLDVEYVAERRLSTDVGILLATLPSMIRGDGAR